MIKLRVALLPLFAFVSGLAFGQESALRAKPDDVNVTWTTGVYAYDGAGNITSITRVDTADAYHYDAFGRLHDATAYVGTQSNLQTFTYDLLGNLTQIDTDGAPRRYIPVSKATNRIELPQNPPTDGTVVTAAYDAAGNQTALNGSYTYTYDGASMMTAMTAAGHTDRYLYDADDQRVAAVSGGTTQRWRYTLRDLDAKFVREYVDDVAGGTHTWSWTKDYVYAGMRPVAAIATSGTTHFHVDHLGTIRLITDGEGHLLSKHTLRPFGEVAAGSDRDAEVIKFTGHERDFAGAGDTDDLDYMHARHFSPLLGRFLAVDPALGTPSSPQSWNRYSYVDNGPLVYTDPTGAVETAFRCDEKGDSCYYETTQPALEYTAADTAVDFVDELGFWFFVHSGAGDTMAGILNDDPAQLAKGYGRQILIAAPSAVASGLTTELAVSELRIVPLPELNPLLTYGARVEARAIEAADSYHNFPFAYDQAIASTGQIRMVSQSYVEYSLPGSVNGVAGEFQIAGRPFIEGVLGVTHRFFRPFP